MIYKYCIIVVYMNLFGDLLGDVAENYAINTVDDRLVSSRLFKLQVLGNFTNVDKVNREQFYQNLIKNKIIITEFKFKMESNNGQRFDKKKRVEFIKLLNRYNNNLISPTTKKNLLKLFDIPTVLGYGGRKKTKTKTKTKTKKNKTKKDVLLY